MFYKKIYEFLKGIDIVEECIFAATTDLDNLGIYVAKNGRAKAENLVDEYNYFVNSQILRFCEEKSVKIYTKDGGEELFIMGVCEKFQYPQIENFIMHDVINLLKSSDLFVDEVTISIGIVNIDSMSIKDEIISAVQNKYDMCMFRILLQKVREMCSIEMDKAKFSNLNISTDEEAIALRNVVYLKMLEYKYSTRALLKKISTSDDFEKIVTNFEGKYGVDPFNYKKMLGDLNVLWQ